MPNQSYLDLEDELRDLESPYSSVSDRTDAPDFAAEAMQQYRPPQEEQPMLPPPSSPMPMASPPAPPIGRDMPSPAPASAMGVRGDLGPSVRDAISQRRGGGVDPLFSIFNKQQKEADQLRDAKRHADLISNVGQGFSQIAQGSSRPTQNTGLYENIAQQNSELLRSKDKDSDRRLQLASAIEARKQRQALAEQSLSNRDATIANTNSRLGTNLVSRIENDPIVKPSQINLASLEKAKTLLNNTDVPLTTQVLSDAENDIANALSLRGMGATEGKIHRTEMQTLGRKIAEFKQKWGDKPVDLRKEQPELVAQVRKLNEALISDYHDTIKQQRNKLLDEYGSFSQDNPRLNAGLERLRKKMEEHDLQTAKPDSGFGLIPTAMADGGKQIAKKQYSPSRNQTRITYSDGSTEVVDGQR